MERNNLIILDDEEVNKILISLEQYALEYATNEEYEEYNNLIKRFKEFK